MGKLKVVKGKSKPPQDYKSKKQKSKRWKKGHSCASNPETTTFRQAAKERLFSVNTGPSSLTVEALARHEAGQIDSNVTFPDIESLSIGATSATKSSCTWASQWTDCTNVTLSRVLQRFAASNLAQHKEVVAVLAAVSEEIKSRGGSESNTEYFAALMTILDSELDMQSSVAVAYLLSIVIKKVPQSAVRSRFSDIARSLINKLEAAVSSEKSEGSALLRSLVLCLSYLLSSLERSAWNNEYTLHVFRSLLPFIASPKAKVRKACHHAMGVVLRGSTFMKADGSSAVSSHPAAAQVAKFCREEIEKCGSGGHITAVLHVLELLKSVISEFPRSALKSTCELVLGLLGIHNTLLTGVVMKTIHEMFAAKPKPTSLPVELNVQIIAALYEHRPNDIDVQPTEAWLAVMEQAHCNMARLSNQDCLQHLPRLFAACMKYMHSGNLAAAKMAAEVFISLLNQCVKPAADVAASLVQNSPAGSSTPVHKMFRVIEAGLGYQYVSVWNLVLLVINQFFEVLGKQCHSIMTKCLLALADLRDYHGFEHKDLLDKTFGTAVRVMGPKVVLAAVPLSSQPTSDGCIEDIDLTHSWMLPVFRDHIQDTQIAFFAEYFLPLASQLKLKCDDYEKNDRVVEYKTCSAVMSQIWSLLPGFCTRPTDLADSFKLIAQTLGECIVSRPDVRMDILSALRKVLVHSMAAGEKERTAVAKYAKNFLPRLFNLIAPVDKEGTDACRLATFETLKCYLKICDRQLIENFAKKCCELMSEKDTLASRKPMLMDLIIAFVPYLSYDSLCILFELVKGLLESKDTDKTLQKKLYRVLEEICAASADDCKRFVSSNESDLVKLLLESVVSSSQPSLAPRLRCLVHFLKQLDKPSDDLLKTIVPEALVATKAVNEKARTAAYSLLVEIAHSFIRWHPELTQQEAVHQYIVMIMAGFAGNPHMIACTVLALTKLVHDHRDNVDEELLRVLIDSACLLVASKAREVVLSALGFIKTLLLSFSANFGAFLNQVVSSLVSMTEDCQRHFRLKVKELFAILTRKFGHDVIYAMVPDSHHKLLNNMRKTQQRKERRKAEEASVESRHAAEDDWARKRKHDTVDELIQSSDSEAEDLLEEPASKKSRQSAREKRSKAWLKEDEDIVDFLDPSAARKVVATKPDTAAGKRKPVAHDFKLSADGRLIITDDSLQQDAKSQPKTSSDVKDFPENEESAERKRRISSRVSDDYEDIDEAEDSKNVYRASGKGIHRPLQSKHSQTAGYQYRAQKAGGDVKKAGKPDPYAYFTLQHQFLNKRKRAKAVGQFKHLVKGAHKGAVKGQKQKRKQLKRSR